MQPKFTTDKTHQLLRSSRGDRVVKVWKTENDRFSYSLPGQSYYFGVDELNGWELIKSSEYLGENPDFPRYTIGVKVVHDCLAIDGPVLSTVVSLSTIQRVTHESPDRGGVRGYLAVLSDRYFEQGIDVTFTGAGDAQMKYFDWVVESSQPN